eukprot:PhM_4_TR13959/c1_g1_i15/m.31953
MDDNQTLNKRISDLEKEAAFYKAKFQEEIARNEDLQANADIAEEIFAQHQELKSTHASTKQRLSELEDQGGIITKLKDDVAVLEKDLAEARQTNHRIEAERDTLRSMATGRYEQLSDNVAALLQRSTDVTTTKSDLQSTREALDTANGKVEELSRAVEALKKALDESQRLCELQKAELQELKDTPPRQQHHHHGQCQCVQHAIEKSQLVCEHSTTKGDKALASVDVKATAAVNNGKQAETKFVWGAVPSAADGSKQAATKPV